MTQVRWLIAAVAAVSVSFSGVNHKVQAEVRYIGSARISGDPDLSHSANGRVHAFGGFSAIEYVGPGNRYIIQPDRGPADGKSDFQCRFHEVAIHVDPTQSRTVQIEFLATRPLTQVSGSAFVGTAGAFGELGSAIGRRLDPEGIRVSGDGMFISDEYGPSLFVFSRQGREQREFPLPNRFQIAVPSADREVELSKNVRGRIPNRGLEGLAITPSGRKLFAAMQGPLIQDSELAANGRRYGDYTRLIEVDLSNGQTREFAYPLQKVTTGVSEVLAVNETELLVLERDDAAGAAATCKQIVRIDLAAASDISSIETLSAKSLPHGVRPVSKSLFIDLLDAKFGLAGDSLPEKFEGLTFGPSLPDGRMLLLLTIDNDFKPEISSQILAFAVDPVDLPAFGWDAKSPTVRAVASTK